MTGLTIRRHLTRADQARDPYANIPVAVPSGTTRIDVVLDYHKSEDCIIDLGCGDPRLGAFPSAGGFRGWSGGARDRFFVALDDATPGYLPGDMPSGDWQVILGLYKVPEEGTDVFVTITLDTAPRALASRPKKADAVREEPGWYRGDLHCHTYHSDARGSPETLHAAARQAGLDFLAVADHNTISQRRYFDVKSSPDLVFVRGMEVTTANGHCNVFGVDDWIDFRMRRPADAHVVARLAHAHGGLLSVNHDKPDIPWDYELPDMDCMEVWQSTWMAWNWISLARYQERLVAGRRISAIGGSDYHQPPELRPEGPLVLARPTTVLWLDRLSERDVLAAMKAGRGYITESPTGPHLELTADGAPMGSFLKGPAREITTRVKGANGDLLVWIDATGEIDRMPITADDQTLTAPGRPARFVRCEIIAKASRPALMADLRAAFKPGPLPFDLTQDLLETQPLRRALSNPIWFNKLERADADK